jgi:hypothetical protein
MSVVVSSGLFVLFYLVWRWVYPGDHVLPVLSGAAFLFAGTFNAFLVASALLVERAVRADPPLWRTRYALALALFWFLSQTIVLGTALPSTEAVTHLGAGLVFGAFMARVVRHDEMVVGDGLFDLERPLWATWTGDVVNTYAGFAPLGVALLMALFAPGTAMGIFLFVPLILAMLPLGLKNRTRWRERELLVLSVTAALMLGLFAPW